MSPLRLRVVEGGAAATAPADAGRAALCAAWPSLDRWEQRAEASFGAEFAELVVVLWTVHRFAACPAGMAVVDALVDESMHLRERQPVLEDLASLAFALGAAWAADGAAPRLTGER